MVKVTLGGQTLREVDRRTARLLGSLPEQGEVTASVVGWSDNEAGVVFALTPTYLMRISRGIQRVPLSSIKDFAVAGTKLRVQAGDVSLWIDVWDREQFKAFDEALHRFTGLEAQRPKPPPPKLGNDRITTFDHLPGHSVTRVLGPVSVLSGASGLTATTKGNTALDRATSQLREAAASLGANAVIGLNASAFGAAGGITGVLGGDAVGVLLIGTAVVVVQDDPAPPHEVSQG